jgi:hypothetical protein
MLRKTATASLHFSVVTQGSKQSAQSSYNILGYRMEKVNGQLKVRIVYNISHMVTCNCKASHINEVGKSHAAGAFPPLNEPEGIGK